MSRVLDAVQAVPAALQGRRVMRDVPRLPEAGGPREGFVPAGNAPAMARGDVPDNVLNLVVLGESTAAGVGARTHDVALVGHLARGLAAAQGRPVRWRVAGRNGATLRRIRFRLLPEVAEESADVIVLMAGVNDVVAGRALSEWGTHMDELLEALMGPGRTVVVPGAPPFLQFPELPEPLRSFLDRRATRLDAVTREVCAQHGALFVPFEPGARIGPDFFATDRFHPSEVGYAEWAEILVGRMRSED